MGLITPPDRIQASLSAFEQIFVKSVPHSITRRRLFDNFQEFTHHFSHAITDQFTQWVGGSFTTQKVNPQDIDVLILCPQEVILKNETRINAELSQSQWKIRGIDCCYLGTRSKGAPDYPLYRSDFTYWVHQFSTTKNDRRGRKHARGFIEINHNKFSYE